MKKSLLMLSALMVLLGSCAPESDELVIGLSLPTQREERWVRDKEKMEAYAAEKGVALEVLVSDADQVQQANQVQTLFTKGIDVLILAPHDASASAPLVKQAADRGIPVISYDRLITNSPELDVYISFDNVKVGELQGKFFTDNVESGNIIIMSGAPTDNNAKLFKQGAMTYIQPKIDAGDYTVVAEQAVDNWEPNNAFNIVQTALTIESDIQGILAPNDGTAGGAISALNNRGLAGSVVITGQDAEAAAARRIATEGTQSMTIFKDTRELAIAAIDAAILLAEGATLDFNGQVDNASKNVDSILLTPFVVDKNNVEELLVESGYLSRSAVFGE
jgi:D-xylose transport system substrate-binding protein